MALMGNLSVSDFVQDEKSGKQRVKFATIAATASGDTEVVAAVSGRKIKVLSFYYVTDAATNIRFRSATNSIAGSGLLRWGAADNGIAPGYSPVGYFIGSTGEALNINLSANANVDGGVTYIEV